MEIRRKKYVSNAVGVTGYVFGNHPLSPDTVKYFSEVEPDEVA